MRRCGDSLFFEVPPLASDALLTTLHPLFENVLQIVDHFEISCLEAPFSRLEKHINRMGRILCSAWKIWIGGTPLEHPPYSPDLDQCVSWAFPTMKMLLRSKKFRSDQRPAARFREVDGALLEVHRLPREVLWKRDRHRTSTKFRLRVNPRNFQTASINVKIVTVTTVSSHMSQLSIWAHDFGIHYMNLCSKF
jgi:hypothetical protein